METKSMYFSTEDADRLRRDFYDQVLSQAPSRPEHDFRRLADAWLAATNADWVWLWLKNPHLENSPWELRELACRSADRDSYLLRPLTVPSINTVTAYCSLTRQPEVVNNIDTWGQNLNGIEYRVACKEKLKELRCRSFVTVPFRSPNHDSEKAMEPRKGRLSIEGAICFHFCEDSKVVEHPVESLRLMGQLSASTIVGSFKTVQQDILFDLNDLAHDYLTRVTRNSSEDRQNYLLAVIRLLQKYLSIGAASVFYQDDPQFLEIRCLATTGISQTPPETVPNDRWSTIVYKPDQGLTGQCFANGKPNVLSAERAQKHTPRYVEVLDNQVVGRNDAVLFPIPRTNLAANMTPPVARGVIRCSDHRTTMGDGATRPFDPVDLQTLEFIAQQIAPVVETLTVRIRREETISIIKHDLLAPLVMIRDTAEELAGSTDNPNDTVKAKYYDVMNLGSAALVASNLVQQLDPDPGKVRMFEPERTLLERSIVARITNLLGHFAYKENQMRIRFEGEEFRAIPPIWIDRDLMERVFVNLLTNAIKYGAAGTTIEMRASVETATDRFRFDVLNQGEGVAEEDRDLVFVRGYRSRSVVGKKMGIGLGLFIARAAVERHGGTLELTSLRNPTTFSIFLPVDLKRWRPK